MVDPVILEAGVLSVPELLRLGWGRRQREAALDDLTAWCRAAPLRVHVLMESVDRAESGTETMVRLRLRARKIGVRTQVRIGRRRVDLLIGDRLIVECDGGEHHASWTAQSEDRERDRELTAAGYTVVRLTYRQIVHDWTRCEADLLRIVRRGGHRAPRRTR